jgi:phosphoribosylanthranilate isomerase
MSIWIKICGTTNLEDAQVAVEAGADALGFIFAPSSRRISPRDAARISNELPEKVERIGVFVNQSPEVILDTVEKTGLSGIQLHGDEDIEFARTLRKAADGRKQRLRIIKALPLAIGGTEKSVVFENGAEAVLDALLLDSGADARRGGTGKQFDWQEAAPMVRFVARRFKVIVAGGLSVSNVAEAMRLFDPWGVDVVSGVEKEPGRKDRVKVRQFIAAVREAKVHAAGEK